MVMRTEETAVSGNSLYRYVIDTRNKIFRNIGLIRCAPYRSYRLTVDADVGNSRALGVLQVYRLTAPSAVISKPKVMRPEKKA